MRPENDPREHRRRRQADAGKEGPTGERLVTASKGTQVANVGSAAGALLEMALHEIRIDAIERAVHVRGQLPVLDVLASGRRSLPQERGPQVGTPTIGVAATEAPLALRARSQVIGEVQEI